MPLRELRHLASSPELGAGVRRAFERHGAPPPRDLAIDYVRWKPSTSCVLGLRGADGPPAPIGYVKIFLTGDPEECARKYRARARDRGWADVLPELSAVFFHFPLDRRVRGLRAVVDVRALKQVVHDVVPGLAPDEERVRSSRSRVSVLRYKPERRCLVRADLETEDRRGTSLERRLVAQAYGDESGARVHRIMRWLWNQGTRGGDALRVPRPLGYHPGRRILLQEWVEGDPWGETLDAPRAVGMCRDAARCLRSLHTLDITDLPGVGEPPESTAAARQVLHDVARVAPVELAEAALALARAIDCAEPHVSRGELTLVHGDFHDRQVLVGRDGPTLIDWDEAGVGDPRLDVGNFLAHLHLAELEGRLPRNRAAALRQAFQEDYRGDQDPPTDLAFFVALHLAKLALAPFRDLTGDWAQESLAIVGRAREVLGTGIEVAA